MEYVALTHRHLPGVLRLCKAQGWPSLPADPERALRALTAPGVITVVAVDTGEVVGFAQMLTDGEIQAYLCNVAVTAPMRRRGIGRKLIQEAFARSGAQRVDVLALEESEDLYRSFPHRRLAGYRVYPRAGNAVDQPPSEDAGRGSAWPSP